VRATPKVPTPSQKPHPKRPVAAGGARDLSITKAMGQVASVHLDARQGGLK